MTTLVVSPGVSGAYPTITLQAYDASDALVSGNLAVTTLQDITVNNANDVFTWTQLNESAKKQIATTSTNSIDTNIVVDDTIFFGNASATSGSSVKLGLLGLSTAKTKCAFTLAFNSATGTDKTVTGTCYVTGLAPTVSADSPVWVTPVSLTVDGEYSWA